MSEISQSEVDATRLIMILPLTLPAKSSSPDSPALPPALARLGSSELFLLELQGELEVSGDKHGQLVGRLTIDDTNDGKVRALSLQTRRSSLIYFFSLFSFGYKGQADTANRPSPLRRQNRQLTQASGRPAAHLCATATTTTTNR